MKTIETNLPAERSAQKSAAAGSGGNSASPARKLRLWPAVLLVIVFWVFHFGSDYVEMSMGNRFMIRFSFYGIVVLSFLVWWLAFSRAKWQDRLLALAAFIVGAMVAGLLADKKTLGSMGPFGALLSGFPFALTLWTAWLVVTDRWLTDHSPATKRIGLVAIILLTFGFFDLVRWEGLDGGQHSAFAWRWSPTAEEQFLAARKTTTADSAPQAKSLELQPGDWPEFRGAKRDSQATDLQLATDWKTSPPKQVWRHRLGPGWSSMIVVDGRLFTQEQRGENEAVVCYDAATGDEKWAHTDATRFEEPLSQAGPRGTPTFAGGNIYALGATGKLNCLNAATGDLIWSRDIAVDGDAVVAPGSFGLRQWGYSNSPLVVGDEVIVFAGGEHDKNVIAYRANSGEQKWIAPAGNDGYSSPQLAKMHGETQLLMHTSAGLKSLNPADGKQLWDLPTTAKMFVPITQPQPVGDDELLAQAEEGVQLVKVSYDAGAVEGCAILGFQSAQAIAERLRHSRRQHLRLRRWRAVLPRCRRRQAPLEIGPLWARPGFACRRSRLARGHVGNRRGNFSGC